MMGSEEGASFSPTRRLSFKPSVTNVAGPRRRQQAITIGKERREAAVRAKRMKTSAHDEDDMEDFVEDEETCKALVEATRKAVEELKLAFTDSSKGASQKKIEALRNLRRLLSRDSMPLVDAAIEAAVVPELVKCLDFGSSDEQLLEAAWCLTNIASGDTEQTRAILPALPFLIAHLGERSSVPVAEQCAWAIGNVAGEGEDLREILLLQGALPFLGRLMLSNKGSTAKTAAWALSNLIKGPNPKASFELMKLDGIPEAITRHLLKGDENLAVEVAWVVVYFTSSSDLHSEALIKAGLLEPLLNRLALSKHLPLLTPVLRSVGNMVAGDNSKTDAIVEAGHKVLGGLIGALVRCLDSEHRTLQKEASWVLSNIAAGSLKHKYLIFSSGAVSSLLHLLAIATFDVRKEAAYALGNLCVTPSGKAGGEPILEHLTVLVDRGCLPGYINLIKSPDLEAARLGLQFLELVLRGLPNGRGPKLVETEDGVAAMEFLEYHENDEIRNMANTLIDRFFGEDYGLDEEYGPGSMEVVRQGADHSEYPPWRRPGGNKFL